MPAQEDTTNKSRPLDTQSQTSLAQLAERWILATRKPKKTAGKTRMIVRYIEDLTHPGIAADEVTKTTLITLQTDALKLPCRLKQSERTQSFAKLAAAHSSHADRPLLSPPAIRAWFNLLSGCYNWGVAAEYAKRNPTIGIKPKVSMLDGRRRLSFDKIDIETIFDLQRYEELTRSSPSKYWLPILALFTGARLNELGQLLKVDVHGTDVPHIRITDESHLPDVRKRLKNFSSRRLVPIHRELVALGFLSFVEDSTGPYLFPDLPHSTNPDAYEPTKAYSQWFGRFLERRGIKTQQKSFHSFRHTFISVARNAGVDATIISHIVGHGSEPLLRGLTGSATTRAYGDTHHLPLLATAIESLSFPGFPINWKSAVSI